MEKNCYLASTSSKNFFLCITKHQRNAMVSHGYLWTVWSKTIRCWIQFWFWWPSILQKVPFILDLVVQTASISFTKHLPKMEVLTWIISCMDAAYVAGKIDYPQNALWDRITAMKISRVNGTIWMAELQWMQFWLVRDFFSCIRFSGSTLACCEMSLKFWK